MLLPIYFIKLKTFFFGGGGGGRGGGIIPKNVPRNLAMQCLDINDFLVGIVRFDYFTIVVHPDFHVTPKDCPVQ